jgi:hypothetical protein
MKNNVKYQPPNRRFLAYLSFSLIRKKTVILQHLEMENFVNFCNIWKRKISIIFATFWKRKISIIFTTFGKGKFQ